MSGTGKSTDSLLQSLQAELRGMAAKKLRAERPDHLLQTTALVNEVYLKLQGEHLTSGWTSRSHFLRASAEAMRRILVDSARARLCQKRGGGMARADLGDIALELPMAPDDLLGIHDCLDRFAEEDEVKAELVKLRVFGGLTQREVAQVLDISRATADRYWAYAKARLMKMMDPESN
ncbi:ECF-type sigma factor [Crateriforma spongiae]|uniref:ECF-type sigma factor n=1 Tax=Crateriforma spongiae TaxID=2724528 RepID=UPI001444FDAF|nr:ECF-type sigma factor [Crateriforma spongiae]